MNNVQLKSQSGFTLLEIMVALALFAGFAASVTQIFASGVGITLDVEQESYAFIHAESKMDEILIMSDVREAEGGGGIANTDYRYQVTITEQTYPGAPRNFELLHILLSVDWGEGRYTNQVVLEALKTQVKQ